MNTPLQPSNRFKRAQTGRSLLHDSLPQPTAEEEARHLMNLVLSQRNSGDSLTEQIEFNYSEVLTCMPCQEPSSDPPSLSSESSVAMIDSDAEASNSEMKCHTDRHTFVVCADSQLGMTSLNQEWETELHYCRLAVDQINALNPRPRFVSMCGDIADMENSFYYNNPNALKNYELEDCERIQQQQFRDFQEVFSKVHPDIAVVCLCGNHDIGNRPTPQSIEKFRSAFGDEYLAFWVNGTYNIFLNNVLFVNPEGAQEMFTKQLQWLQERLEYATKHRASQIYVFGHHPFFLYSDEEDSDDFVPTVGVSFPSEWNDGSGRFDKAIFPDEYFSMPKKYRQLAMNLFKQHNVNACFSGHFHQNHVAKSSFGMDMIITGPLSLIFESSGKPKKEIDSRGIRVIEVHSPMDAAKRRTGPASFTHHFQGLKE
jgi:hypothetical protein